MNKSTILQTNNLGKQYKDTKAVDHFNLNIKQGDIYGLVGENGAGKTTLIRMITSLSIPTEGSFSLFGSTTEAEMTLARNRIGSVIETPAFYPKMTAKQNLEYYRLINGIPNKSIVEETLTLVGLNNTGKKKFKHFSMGMKQRLGLGLALLKKPDFIILDEPINGLDPMGIVEIRELITRLKVEQGITFLISSHILQELAMVSSKFAFIHNGILIKDITKEELQEECQNNLAIHVDDVNKAAAILETTLKTTNYKVVDNHKIHLYDFIDQASHVMSCLVSGGVMVSSLNEEGDSLENYYLTLLKGVM